MSRVTFTTHNAQYHNLAELRRANGNGLQIGQLLANPTGQAAHTNGVVTQPTQTTQTTADTMAQLQEQQAAEEAKNLEKQQKRATIEQENLQSRIEKTEKKLAKQERELAKLDTEKHPHKAKKLQNQIAENKHVLEDLTTRKATIDTQLTQLGEKLNKPVATTTTPVAPQATTSTKPKYTYSNYAQEQGTVYHRPAKSGVVRADEIAAQRIAENAAKQRATAVQPQATSSTPVATPEPTLKKTYVKPTVAPASDFAKNYLELETLINNDTPLEEQATNGSRKIKTPEQRAEQLRRIRSNPKAKAKYNAMKLKNNPELASRYESFCQSAKKAGKMKGLKKAGKWGTLAALAVGAIALTVKACGGDQKAETIKDETVKPETKTQKPEPQTTTPQATQNDTSKEADKVKEAQDEQDIREAEEADKKEQAPKAEHEYKVQKGDSFWRIAEQKLINEYKKAQEAKGEAVDENYKPTDAEILKETERLVEKNKYQFDEKHWNTIPPIYEGDILNIAA